MYCFIPRKNCTDMYGTIIGPKRESQIFLLCMCIVFILTKMRWFQTDFVSFHVQNVLTSMQQNNRSQGRIADPMYIPKLCSTDVYVPGTWPFSSRFGCGIFIHRLIKFFSFLSSLCYPRQETKKPP